MKCKIINQIIQNNNSEFEPCTKRDQEVERAMKDPGYLLRHSMAVKNF